MVYYYHGREVGFIRRFIIIIATIPFDIEGREVGVFHGLWFDILYGTLLGF